MQIRLWSDQMLSRKNQYRNRCRTNRAAIIAEHSVVLYMLFLFLFFPLLDLAVMGLRAFFLWFACNQAAMAGAKGTQWMYSGAESEDNVYYTSIQTQAVNACTSVIKNFSGITITSVPATGYGTSPSPTGPILQVVLTAIKHSDTTNNQPAGATKTYLASQLPMAITPDPSQYIPMLQCTLTGTISPFINIPLPFSAPGLNKPFSMSVVCEQQIENPYALMY